MENIIIDNLKCGGCANTITNSLSKMDNVTDVKVDVETSIVSFEVTSEEAKAKVIAKLNSLGYPPEGTSTGIQKAKSYVSCAIGKVS